MAELQSVFLTELLHRKATGLSLPISGTFELSPVCNLSCRMCYVRKTAKEVADSPRPILNMSRWLELADQARDAGMLYLLLTGGEPFLLKDFQILYEALVKKGILVSINTNGTLIDEETVDWLKKLPPRRVNLTLYGASDETYRRLCGVSGVFDRVDQAITLLKEAGVSLRLNLSLTPDNVCDLEQLMDYGRDRDIPTAVATYMFPPLRRDETQVGLNARFTPREAVRYQEQVYRLQYGEKYSMERMRKILEGSVPPPGLDEYCEDPIDGKVRCRAGRASFWITWDGYMTPCGTMVEPKADLTGRSFAEAWQETVVNTANIRLSGVCDQCANRDLCHVCAAMAQTETGSFTEIPRYLCERAKELRILAKETLAEKKE